MELLLLFGGYFVATLWRAVAMTPCPKEID
jgi:hypothetical protein